jgi:hypothetical protein
MKEDEMVQKVQGAVAALGDPDEIVAAGIFFPRGHFGGAFAGGMAGGSLGDAIGGVAGGVGIAGGVLAGQHAADAASGLPERMFVGVSASHVYGFDTVRDHGREPTDLIFRLPREQLETKVHQRVNVRVLELIDTPSGSRVELEGARMGPMHPGAVIDALHG